MQYTEIMSDSIFLKQIVIQINTLHVQAMLKCVSEASGLIKSRIYQMQKAVHLIKYKKKLKKLIFFLNQGLLALVDIQQ